jgi:hypothetical protein
MIFIMDTSNYDELLLLAKKGQLSKPLHWFGSLRYYLH